jgi:peroxiredoxin
LQGINVLQKKKYQFPLLLVFSAFHILSAEDRLIGSPAPDFSMQDIASSTRNEYVLSHNFTNDGCNAVAICFFASWCGLCLQEMKLVKSLTDSLYKGNLAMVAISVESEYGPSQQKFVKSIGLTCPILLDTLRRISKQYRIKQQLPYSVFITKKGIVYTTVSGYSPRAKRYIYLALDKMMASEQKGRK